MELNYHLEAYQTMLCLNVPKINYFRRLKFEPMSVTELR